MPAGRFRSAAPRMAVGGVGGAGALAGVAPLYQLTKAFTSPAMVHGVVREGRGATGGQSEAMRRPQRAARACSAILLRACES